MPLPATLTNLKKQMMRQKFTKTTSHLTWAIALALPLFVISSGYAQDPNPSTAVPVTGGPTQNAVGATAASNTEATAERVIVTGSNIPTAEEVGPNPVDTYRAEDLQKLGVRTATDLTQRLPAVSGGSITENIANGGDGRTEINLRGIFPKETLVLQDGRRLSAQLAGSVLGGQSVNINLFPLGLIDHIDILKDGASAIYGSDAVAGVFNVYLKHKFRGLEIYGSYGNTNLGASNDAREIQGYLLAGTGDDKTDIVVYAEYYDRAAIYSRDRDLSSNGSFRNFGDDGIADARSGNYPGRVQGFVFIPGRHGNGLAPTPRAAVDPASDPQYVPRNNVDFNSNFFAFNFASLTPSIPAADRQYFYGSFMRDLCDKWLQVFADFKYTRSFFDAGAAPVPFSPDPFLAADGITPFSGTGFSVPLSNAFNPFTAPSTNPDGTPAILPDGTPVVTGVRFRGLEEGPRQTKTTVNDYVFTGGLRGQFSDLTTNDILKTWGYEVGFRYNYNEEESLALGNVSKPGLRDALRDTNPLTAFNPFLGFGGTNTAAAQSRVYVDLHNTSINSLTLEDAKLYGDLFNIPAGPVSFALGAEHRTERYKNTPDSLNTTFSTIGSTDLEASKGNRDVFSLYGELRIPITSPSWNFPGAYSFEFDVAERYENFSDLGETEKPKFSVRYQPIDSSLTLRATYNEAFHAPFLNELSPGRAEAFPAFIDPTGLSVEQQTRALVGGNPNLRPENAYEFSFGAVFSPKWVKGLTLSADVFHIDLRDAVSPLSVTDLLNINFRTATQFSAIGAPLNGQFQANILRDPATGEVLQVDTTTFNLGRVIVEGLDYEAIYQLDTAMFGAGNFGTVTFTLNGTYLSRFEFASSPGAKEFDLTGSILSFGSLPHTRAYVSVFYDIAGFDAGATVHYIGQYDDAPGTLNDGGSRKIREYTTLDILASYTFNLPQEVPEQQQVAGYSKDGGKNVRGKDGKDKNVMPVSTATYSECGWRSWLNGTTITLGMNNVFDQDPPFAINTFENGYDESVADIKGRFWYVALKKRF